MANNIELATKFTTLIDDLYKKESLTAILDAPTKVDFTGGNSVKVMKVSATGLGDYSREEGYAKGNASLVWETLTLGEDRSAEINVDRMDNEETLGVGFGAVMGEFSRVNVLPEVDAFRFAKYAQTAGIGSASGVLADGEAVVKALRANATYMDENEVPESERILYITPTLYGLVEDLDTTKSRAVLNRFSTIIKVPQSRFYSKITMNDGTSNWGFAKAADGKNLNFLTVAKSAVLQATKHALPKVFDPDTNQKKDAWLFQYRLYHDAFVYENKEKGVYAHIGE